MKVNVCMVIQYYWFLDSCLLFPYPFILSILFRLVLLWVCFILVWLATIHFGSQKIVFRKLCEFKWRDSKYSVWKHLELITKTFLHSKHQETCKFWCLESHNFLLLCNWCIFSFSMLFSLLEVIKLNLLLKLHILSKWWNDHVYIIDNYQISRHHCLHIRLNYCGFWFFLIYMWFM